jgi:hypothetical protein
MSFPALTRNSSLATRNHPTPGDDAKYKRIPPIFSYAHNTFTRSHIHTLFEDVRKFDPAHRPNKLNNPTRLEIRP